MDHTCALSPCTKRQRRVPRRQLVSLGAVLATASIVVACANGGQAMAPNAAPPTIHESPDAKSAVLAAGAGGAGDADDTDDPGDAARPDDPGDFRE